MVEENKKKIDENMFLIFIFAMLLIFAFFQWYDTLFHNKQAKLKLLFEKFKLSFYGKHNNNVNSIDLK
jgi:hypothetical protein